MAAPVPATFIQNLFGSLLLALGPNNCDSCSIVASQVAYEPLDQITVDSAVANHPLEPLRNGPLIDSPVANCHDFAWALKNKIDDDRRQFFENMGSGIQGQITPVAIGIVVGILHVVNAHYFLDKTDTGVIRLVDSYGKQPSLMYTAGQQLSDADKSIFGKFLNNSKTNGTLQVSIVYF